MHNELFSIGPFTVYGYGLMTALGIISAYLTATYRSKKLGLDPERIFGLVIFCAVFGYASSKALYCITILPKILEDPSSFLTLATGWVVYGGIIGGIFGGWLYCRIKKIDFIAYFDMAIPSVALAQGFGRIGCFLAGCCYGLETDCPISITFTHSEFAPNNVSLIPTQLYSSAFDFALAFFLMFLAKKTRKKGVIAAAYLVAYSTGRFVIEFFRGDLIRGSVGALSTSQFIAVFMIAAGVILLIFSIKKADALAVDADAAAGADGRDNEPDCGDDAHEG